MMSSKRYEFKYIIPESTYSEILEILTYHGKRDQNAGRDGSYVVNSLYLDTHNWKFYHQKKMGLDPRSKLRWRWYDQEMESLKLEVKHRLGDSLFKIQSPLPVSNLPTFLENIDSFRRKASSDLAIYLGEEIFREKIFIRYRRYAFSFGDHRITYDVKLEYAKYFSGCLPHFIPFYRGGVLELKGSSSLPDIVRNLISDLRLSRTSFSKYERGLEASGLI